MKKYFIKPNSSSLSMFTSLCERIWISPSTPKLPKLKALCSGLCCSWSISCPLEIQEWMSNNYLKLNAEKPEILIFGFRAQLAKFSVTHVQIAGVDIPVLSRPIKNLGVMFDCHMSMSAQVASVIKAANFQFVNIGRARYCLQLAPLNSPSIL